MAGTEWNPTVDYLLLKVSADGRSGLGAVIRRGVLRRRRHGGGRRRGPRDDQRLLGARDHARRRGRSSTTTRSSTTRTEANDGPRGWNDRVTTGTSRGPPSPAIAVDGDGEGVVLTGAVGPQGDDSNFLLLKYGAGGEELFDECFRSMRRVASYRSMTPGRFMSPLRSTPNPTTGGPSSRSPPMATCCGRSSTDPVQYMMPSSLSLMDDRLVMTGTPVRWALSQLRTRFGSGSALTAAIVGRPRILSSAWPDIHCGPDYSLVPQRTGSCLAPRVKTARSRIAGQGGGPPPSFAEIRDDCLSHWQRDPPLVSATVRTYRFQPHRKGVGARSRRQSPGRRRFVARGHWASLGDLQVRPERDGTVDSVPRMGRRVVGVGRGFKRRAYSSLEPRTTRDSRTWSWSSTSRMGPRRGSKT